MKFYNFTKYGWVSYVQFFDRLQQGIIFVYQLLYQTMRSGKSQIKSKKVKLIEKKHDKKQLTVKPIEISSSEDEQHNQSIQKRRSNISKASELPKKYNNFNIQKLKKIQIEPSRGLMNEKELLIQQNIKENPMQHTQSRALFSYKIEGNDSTKYVSDLYLQQRVKKLAQEQLTKIIPTFEGLTEEKDIKEEKKDNSQGNESQKDEEKKERSRPIRYFQSLEEQDNQNRLVKCFRCGKKGHIAKNCLEQRQQAKCMFCLDNHHHHDCNSRACFRCNEIGHVAQECRATGMQCRKCGKKGHIEKNCGAIVYLDYSRIKSDYEYQDKYSREDLKKLRCMAGCSDPNGHFNCHKYHQYNYKQYQEPISSFKNLSRYRYNDFDRDYEYADRRPSYQSNSNYQSSSRNHSSSKNSHQRYRSSKW